MTRDELLEEFLTKNNWGTAKRELLAHDASFRWYDRLTKGSETCVLMNAPKPENPSVFVFIDKILRQYGINAPKIYAEDLENGFLLLEDFGDNTFTRLIAKGYNEKSLYKSAIDELIKLQKRSRINPGIKEYDQDLMLFEASLLTDWFIPYVVGKNLSTEDKEQFEQIWIDLIRQIHQVSNTLVLLDYHVDNLMIDKNNRCGVLDFQDARFGPVTYDLASLLEDARRPVDENLQQEMKQYYFEHLPEYNTPEFHNTYPLMAVQRHTKVIGIFVRLCVRDHKDRYLKHIPFVWSLLEKHLDHPLLAQYKTWLDEHVPPVFRHQDVKIIQRNLP